MAKAKTKRQKTKKGTQADRPSQGKNRMEEVYVKAARLFRKKGYQRATMNDIAEELKIQKASLYYYVSDKETLLFQILDRTMDGLLKRVADLHKLEVPTKVKLDQAIHEHLCNVLEYRDELTILINEARNLRPELRDIIVSKRKQYEEVFLGIIREGIANGTVTEHDQHMVAFLILGGIYWFYQWFSPEEFRNQEEIGKKFAKILYNGILVERT